MAGFELVVKRYVEALGGDMGKAADAIRVSRLTIQRWVQAENLSYGALRKPALIYMLQVIKEQGAR